MKRKLENTAADKLPTTKKQFPYHHDSPALDTASTSLSKQPHKIIDVPEVLENILLHLDLRTLLVAAQRVNKDWCSMIQHSPSLQKALFFLPDDTPPFNGGKSVDNPLLAELFPEWFKNPNWTGGQQLPSNYDNQAFINKQAALEEPSSSWRKMLVQQNPPIRTIGCWGQTSTCGVVTNSAKMLSTARNDGLRMGQYFALTHHLIGATIYLVVHWKSDLSRFNHMPPGKRWPWMSNTPTESDFERVRKIDEECVLNRDKMAASADLIIVALYPLQNITSEVRKHRERQTRFEHDYASLVGPKGDCLKETTTWAESLEEVMG